MKPFIIFIFAVQLAASANPYLGNPIADIIEAGFEASSDTQMWNLEFGFDVWKADVVDREGMLSSERKLGNFSGYDMFWWDIVSKHNCVVCVSLNYRNGPIFLLMHGYKNSSGWQIRRIEQIHDMKYFIPLQTGPEDFAETVNQHLSRRNSAFPPRYLRDISQTLRGLKFEIRRLKNSVDSLTSWTRTSVADSVPGDSSRVEE